MNQKTANLRTLTTRLTPLLRFLVYQMIWWLLVYSVKIEDVSGIRYFSYLVAFVVSLASLNIIITRGQVAGPRRLLLAMVTFGFTIDSAAISIGLIETRPTFFISNSISLAPPWLFAIWISFAAMGVLSVSQDSRNLFATSTKKWTTLIVLALLGAIGGPLSYMVGEPLGVLKLLNRPLSVIVLAIEWAILFPAFLVLAWFASNPRVPALKKD